MNGGDLMGGLSLRRLQRLFLLGAMVAGCVFFGDGQDVFCSVLFSFLVSLHYRLEPPALVDIVDGPPACSSLSLSSKLLTLI